MVLALLFATATAVAAPGGLPAARAQAPGAVPGFQIAPPRIEQDLGGRSFSFEVSFGNNAASIVSPTFELTGLGHDLDGNPLFPPRAPALGSTRLTPASARLAPGEAAELVLRGQVPPGAGGVYAGVVATVPPPAGVGTGIDITERLATLVLLRGPKPWVESIVLETVSARPAAKAGTVELFAQVRNTGNVHVRPGGRIKVIREGRTLDTVELKPDIVIPGYARRLGGSWRFPSGLEGTVRLEATIDGPVAPGKGAGTGTAVFEDGKFVQPVGGPGIRAGNVESPAATLDGEGGSDSNAWRIFLSILGAALLLALAIASALAAKGHKKGD